MAVVKCLMCEVVSILDTGGRKLSQNVCPSCRCGGGLVLSEMPTTKQMDYRTDLQIGYLHALGDELIVLQGDARCMKLAQYALVLALPMPTNRQEASDQIDALKALSILQYAKAHAEWGQGVMIKLANAFGERWDPVPSVEQVREVVLS